MEMCQVAKISSHSHWALDWKKYKKMKFLFWVQSEEKNQELLLQSKNWESTYKSDFTEHQNTIR